MTFQVKLALRYLRGRRLRTGLTLMAIVFGVMMIFGFNGILPAMQQAIQGGLAGMADQVDLTVSSETRGAFAADVVAKVADTPGIALVAPSLVRPLILPPAQSLSADNGTSVTSFVVRGVDPELADKIDHIALANGRFLQTADTNAILISNNLAQQTGLGVGDSLDLPAASGLVTFAIVGVTTGRPPQSSEELFMPLAAAQALYNLPGQINTIEARFAADSDGETVRQAVLDKLGSGFKLGGATAGSEFASALEAANYIYNMFGIIAIILGGFIIFITFRTIIVERRRDIGMLRAIGASRKTILGMLLTESLVLGVMGTGLGILAGYAMAAGLLIGMRGLIEDLMRTNIGGPSFAPWVFALSIGMGIGITLLAGLAPALAAMRVSPLEALRPSLAEVERRSASRSAIVGVVLIVIAFITLVTGSVSIASFGILLFLTGLVLIGPALVYPIARIFGR
ncbi:MAG: ABC transporter permease, partial [Anaerolineales bacterium]|nr:ABC transporter permease [Anaerolineales bacterium]